MGPEQGSHNRPRPPGGCLFDCFQGLQFRLDGEAVARLGLHGGRALRGHSFQCGNDLRDQQAFWRLANAL